MTTLTRCYRTGGAELFVLVPPNEAKLFCTEAEWLIRLNQLAYNPGLPDITMFQVAVEQKPGVFTFKDPIWLNS